MSELEKLEQKIVSLFEENNRNMDRRFESIDRRFESIDQRFEDIEIDIKMIRIEMQKESNRIQEKIQNEVQKLDDRMRRLEVSDREKWNVPELRDRVDMLERFVQKHPDRIETL